MLAHQILDLITVINTREQRKGTIIFVTPKFRHLRFFGIYKCTKQQFLTDTNNDLIKKNVATQLHLGDQTDVLNFLQTYQKHVCSK